MNKEKYYYKKEISMSVTVIVLITIFIKILINNKFINGFSDEIGDNQVVAALTQDDKIRQPEYFEFNDIKDKCTTYINRINSVGAIQAIFTYILVCSVVFGVPLNFTSVPDIIKILGVASLPISIVGIIITSVLKYTQLNKAKDAEKQLAKYIYEHKNNIEEY